MMNDTFDTKDFHQAAFLRARGVLFKETRWPTPYQAVFVFNKPSDKILADWQSGQDKVSARALKSAMDFLRDELRKRGE